MTSERAEADLPKLLFIRHKPRRTTADFLNVIEDGWQQTLGMHCRLSMIDQDFDYGEVCDRLQPDLVVLEDPGGYRPDPIRIRNIAARPDIPLTALQIQDPHDTARVEFLRLIDELKIERFFTLGTAVFRQSPELAPRAYALGQYIDGDLYRDYGLEKDLPVTVFGGLIIPRFYNWRTAMAHELPNHVPTFIYTHPGYQKEKIRHRFPVSGQTYARMLNRSHFSLADSTREGYVVRKHLEIPASGAVLVSPDHPEVRCYGFRDLENCILGEGKDVIEKIKQVADDPALYERIRKAGHDLVHARFTRRQWSWIPDWWRVWKTLKPGEVVQQKGYLGPFVAVPGDASTPAVDAEPLADTDFAMVMRDSLANILSPVGDLDRAEGLLSEAAQWLLHVNEPWVPLGIVSLLRGKPDEARVRLLFPGQTRNSREGVSSFDPEEIAWLWIAALQVRDVEFLRELEHLAKGMNHVSLRRLDALKRALQGDARGLDPSNPDLAPRQGDRLSIHWTGQLSFADWSRLAERILAVRGV